jgi:hypothetical protein
MKLVYEQNAFLGDLAKLFTFCDIKGFMLSGGELWRTSEQQEIYVKQGKSKTLNSNHCRRLALDLNFFKDNMMVVDKIDLQPIGDYWEGLSPENRWGGNFKSILDCPHFERSLP